jgi:hypothetical protein
MFKSRINHSIIRALSRSLSNTFYYCLPYFEERIVIVPFLDIISVKFKTLKAQIDLAKILSKHRQSVINQIMLILKINLKNYFYFLVNS